MIVDEVDLDLAVKVIILAFSSVKYMDSGRYRGLSRPSLKKKIYGDEVLKQWDRKLESGKGAFIVSAEHDAVSPERRRKRSAE